jgi:transmembrane sensor
MNDPAPIEVTEAACAWLDRLSVQELSPKDREEFADWLVRSPVHIEEFLRISALHTELRDVLAARPEWAQRLVEQANDTLVDLHGRDDRVTDLDVRPTANPHRDVEFKKSAFRWSSAAAAFTLVVGATFWALQPNPAKTIATEVGEQRVLVLADGSTLKINTDSEVRVRMNETLREIELYRGELLVDVARDSERPFRVRTDRAVVEAVGTRFNVYRRDQATEVTVVEGRVEVLVGAASADDNRRADQPPLELGAGRRLVVAQNEAPPTPVIADVDKTTAWTQRRLVFDEQTVAAVAAEFNRYNRIRVIVADPVLAERRISGVIDVDDPGAFVTLLGGLDAIEVQLTSEGHRRLSTKHEM